MPTGSDAHPIELTEASRDAGAAILDRAARSALGVSGDTFLHCWDRGEYDNSEDPAVARVALLIPFVR